MAAASSGGGDRNGGTVVKRRSDLTSPRHRYRFDVSYDPEAFGQFSESIARYLGTARFLVWQTVVVVVWLAFNLLPPDRYQFDPGIAVSCCSRSCCRCRRHTRRR